MNIVYDRNPKIHLGFVYGLKQASVISKLTINFGTQPDKNLTTLLVNFVFGKLNINQRYLRVETHDFFEIVARIVIKIQRNIKLPIYNQYQVLGTSSTSEAIHGGLLIPVLNGTAYRISLDWTVNLLNLILQGNNLEDFQSNTGLPRFQ